MVLLLLGLLLLLLLLLLLGHLEHVDGVKAEQVVLEAGFHLRFVRRLSFLWLRFHFHTSWALLLAT